MVKWKEEMTIKQPIDIVWQLFSDENAKILYPKLEDHVLVENENDETGGKHAQSYMEGNQLQTYIVETVLYDDKPNKKLRHTRFSMNNIFQLDYTFILNKKNEEETHFTYEGSQRGVTITGKMIMMVGSKNRRQQTVQNFMQQIEAKLEKLKHE